MKNSLLPALIVIFSAIASPLAHAHAFVDFAQPRVGSTVPASPHAVKIWFTEGLDHTQSTIAVFNSAGTEVDQKDSNVEANNRLLMIVSLQPRLPDGIYKVVWSAIAVDSHHTQGTFTFTIRRPGAASP